MSAMKAKDFNKPVEKSQLCASEIEHTHAHSEIKQNRKNKQNKSIPNSSVAEVVEAVEQCLACAVSNTEEPRVWRKRECSHFVQGRRMRRPV